jgi:hypothetical protein
LAPFDGLLKKLPSIMFGLLSELPGNVVVCGVFKTIPAYS